jgi:16S rRNA (cytosine1402-N4)-methyltransferase
MSMPKHKNRKTKAKIQKMEVGADTVTEQQNAGTDEPPRRHLPVLLQEVIDGINPQPGDLVLDGTVGAGGHAAALLELTSPNGRLLGLDLDEVALETARKNLARFSSRVMLVRGSYRNAVLIAAANNLGPFQAALLDLGFSSMEIDDPTRGFSFRHDGPLDMRYDANQELTAAEVVNTWSREELVRILQLYGEEKFAYRIADALIAARRRNRFTGTLQLAEAIAECVPSGYRRGPIHCATRTFQALRIAVNDELGSVEAALPDLLDLLAPGGRLAIISFHSLEDRIVKQFMRQEEKAGRLTPLTKRPVTAGEQELRENPRARSAKLRVAVKNF